MNYRSYAEYEMKLAEVDSKTQEAVFAILDGLSDEGHSGASMSIVTQGISHWLRACKGGEDPKAHIDELPTTFRSVLSDMSPEEVVNTVFIANALARYEPLTPLTGDDDEWIDLSSYGSDVRYQNRRMFQVFKDDKKAYRTDQYLFAYPSPAFTSWWLRSRGNEFSSQVVTFPYNPQAEENQPRHRYFASEDWTQELPEGMDHVTWLNWMRTRYLAGVNPATNQVREDVMFFTSEERAPFEVMLRQVLCYLKYGSDNDRGKMSAHLDWLYDSNETLEFNWTEPKDIDDDSEPKYHSVITKQVMGGRLSRMLALLPKDIDFMVSSKDKAGWPMFIDRNGREYYLVWREVHTATKHFQNWEPTGRYVPMFYYAGERYDQGYFYDAGQPVLGDEQDYLYRKRRELGLAHPRGRNTTHLKMVDDGVCPEKAADAVITSFQLDVKETEQIDNVVAKHVGQVFGTNKKKDT